MHLLHDGAIRAVVPWADVLSLTRVPLGAAFLWLVVEPWLGVALMAAAALTDVMDGWVARRSLPRSHQRGDWLDPLCDKIFVAFVLLTLTLTFHAPAILVLLVMLRDILQVASLLIYAAVAPLRRHGPYNYRANLLGKLTTILQFATALWILFGGPEPWALAAATAIAGAASLATYIWRVVPKRA